MTQRMILNETAWFGAGSLRHLPEEVRRRGMRKALIVTDKALAAAGVLKRVTDLLTAHQLAWAVYDAVVPNPTIRTVQQGVAAFREAGADYLIAVGGGSPQDTSKAIGIIITNPEFEDVRSLEGVAPTRYPAVPIIALPTTAGTAAEVTINYVITDEENRRKFVCVDPHSIPKVAIIDAEMMVTMPASLRAATGIDALTHAIEGYLTRNAWAMTDMLHLKAIRIISQSLRGAVAGELESAEQMALGQYVAGMGFSNVGLGLVHGMAHPLGAFYSVPHGVANAILLPQVMAWNAPCTGEKYRHIAHAMGVKQADSLPLAQARDAAVGAVRQLCHDVGIPRSLREVGLQEADIPALAQAALDDVCTGGNPRTPDLAAVMALYRQS